MRHLAAMSLAATPPPRRPAAPDPEGTRRALGGAVLGAAAAAACAAPVLAAETKTGEVVSNHVDLPSLVLPVARDGRLLTYLFVQARVHFADSRSAEQIRNHQFFARDAVVRATGRTHIMPGNRPETFDARGVQQLIATAVASCMPGIRVARVELRATAFMR